MKAWFRHGPIGFSVGTNKREFVVWCWLMRCPSEYHTPLYLVWHLIYRCTREIQNCSKKGHSYNDDMLTCLKQCSWHDQLFSKTLYHRHKCCVGCQFHTPFCVCKVKKQNIIIFCFQFPKRLYWSRCKQVEFILKYLI